MKDSIEKKLSSAKTFLNRWNNCCIKLLSIDWGKTLSIKLFKKNIIEDYLIVSCTQPKILATLEDMEDTSMNIKYDEASELFIICEENKKCTIYCNDLNFYEYIDANNYKESRIKKAEEYNKLFTQLNLSIKLEQIVNHNLVIKLFKVGEDKFSELICLGSVSIEGVLDDLVNEKLIIDYDEENDSYRIADTGGNIKIICSDFKM